MFKVKKTAPEQTKDVRLTLPVETWQALELVATREGVDWQEVARQALAHALKAEIKNAKRSDGESSPRRGRKKSAE